MDWKDYEKEVYSYFLEQYPEAQITYNARLIGRYSKKERQVDVLIEDDVAGLPIKIAVDTKYFSRRVDVKHTESFIAMMEDIEVDQGLLITQKGYSDAAINRAYYGPNRLELDILNFEDLQDYQGLRAIPYAGKSSILLPAPFGWVIDSSRQPNYLACLYQRGLELKSAQKNQEWIYLDCYHKDEKASSVSELVEMQNDAMRACYTNLCIRQHRPSKRKDGRNTYIRVATADQLPCQEITGYIDCDEFIVFFVLFTKEELENRNLRKLAYILKYSMPVKISFDNTKVIEQLKNKCGSIGDPIEKADAYRQLADWYAEMDSHDRAMEYRRLSWETHPEIYENIQPLIKGELNLSNIDSAIRYSLGFFSLAPENPRIMQDLLSIYDSPAYADIFYKIVGELKSIYHNNNKALGNIHIHYGMYLRTIGSNSAAIEHFRLAKQFFMLVDKTHYIINQIEEILDEIV